MKKFKASLFGVIFLVAITSLSFGQIAEKDTAPRNATSVQKEVEIILGCHYTVVSFNGVATTKRITAGSGILCGFEVVSVSEGGALQTSEFIKVYDLASTSGLILSSASKFGVLPDGNKIVPDVLFGPVSLAGALPTSFVTNPGVRQQFYQYPIQFENGIVIDYDSGPAGGSMGFYWKK